MQLIVFFRVIICCFYVNVVIFCLQCTLCNLFRYVPSNGEGPYKNKRATTLTFESSVYAGDEMYIYAYEGLNDVIINTQYDGVLYESYFYCNKDYNSSCEIDHESSNYQCLEDTIQGSDCGMLKFVHYIALTKTHKLRYSFFFVVVVSYIMTTQELLNWEPTNQPFSQQLSPQPHTPLVCCLFIFCVVSFGFRFGFVFCSREQVFV